MLNELAKIQLLSRSSKRLIMLIADMVMLPIALWTAFALRLGELQPDVAAYWWIFLAAPILSIPIFINIGLYRAVVRFMGMNAVFAIFKAVTLSTLLLAAVVLMTETKGVPRSVFLIYWAVAVIYIGGSRMLMRSYFQSLGLANQTKENLIIYGAGSAGAQLASALLQGNNVRPIAFVDDNKALQGSEIQGIKIYSSEKLNELIKKHKIKQILLAMPSISRTRRIEIVDKLEPLPVHVRTIPGMTDLISGKAQLSELREVGLDDLLGRDPVLPHKELLSACIEKKNILVTGAGGSIGSELCRQIILLKPKSLILYEISEFALYAVENELEKIKEKYNLDLLLIPLLGSVLDQQRLKQVLKIYGINTIYHAAAYKHVPLVEHNVIEGVKNNIFGTYYAAKAALEADVDTFVLISTDKAVRPTNIMGASKRFAELILQGLSQATANEIRTHFCMVRFGNVLGSSGSVVPLFQEQIQHGGPVTVTHPQIIRYFMTIPEAAQLVIQASAMGEKGEVFVLDMGEPVKILDLAKRMIHLSGLTVKDEKNPDGDIEIKITGLRSGEKLYEELLIGDNATGTQHPRIMQAEESALPLEEITKILDELEKSIEQYDIRNIIRMLTSTVSGYSAKKGIRDYLWLAQNAEVAGDSIIENDNIIELNEKLIPKETK
jgi:FlaA1/EpsC-like NDP-sugar epimerase